MRHFFLRFAFLSALSCAAIFPISGCNRYGNTFDMSHRAAAWNASKTQARQELTEIAAPSKSTYLAVSQPDQWKNPLLTIDSNMIQLRIYLPDENSSAIDRGGLTRMAAARKQVLNIRLANLPEALSALPDGAWPYGRVVAIAAEQQTPQNRDWFPSHLAITTQALQDMGVVVDDWNNPLPAR